MSIEINNESEATVDERAITSVARYVLDTLGINPMAELSILVVDSEAMATLHKQWMDLDGPTDVMAFPMDTLDDKPGAATQETGRRRGQQVETLLRIEPADHPEHRRVVGRVETDARQEVGPAGGLAGEVRGRIRRREVGVGRRVPDGRVEAVEDAEVAVALRPQRGVEAEPEIRPQRLAGVRRADGVDQVRSLDPGPQQVDPDRVPGDDTVARREAQVAD